MNTKDNFIAKRGATLILKITLLVIACVVILLGIFALPDMWRGGQAEFPLVAFVFPPMVLGLYATMLPFFFGLWQAFKLISYVEKNKTFSDLSVQAIKKIKYAALVIGIIYMSGLPLLYPIADTDDAPGLLLFGFLFASIPIVVAVFAEVLERLLQNAVDLKSENELTV